MYIVYKYCFSNFVTIYAKVLTSCYKSEAGRDLVSTTVQLIWSKQDDMALKSFSVVQS